MIRVKICGVTTLADALAAADAGADMLGLNFYPPSPRALTVEAARALASALRAELGDACPLLVGVFVNERAEAIRGVVRAVGLDAAQLSGDEPFDTLAALEVPAFKALRPSSVEDAAAQIDALTPYLPADRQLPQVLVDAYHPTLYGGTGEAASAEVVQAVQARAPRLMLAGGLTPENVAARAARVQPWGVDVASGVEVEGRKGVKDHAKMRAFVAAARRAIHESETT